MKINIDILNEFNDHLAMFADEKNWDFDDMMNALTSLILIYAARGKVSEKQFDDILLDIRKSYKDVVKHHFHDMDET